jgi:hypothetical protein
MENMNVDFEILKELYVNKTLECERCKNVVDKLNTRADKYYEALRKVQHIVENSPKISEKTKNYVNSVVDEVHSDCF